MHIERIIYPHLGIIDEVEVLDDEDTDQDEETNDKAQQEKEG
jgi:hypothetical protein